MIDCNLLLEKRTEPMMKLDEPGVVREPALICNFIKDNKNRDLRYMIIIIFSIIIIIILSNFKVGGQLYRVDVSVELSK